MDLLLGVFHIVALASLKFNVVLLPPPPMCWGHHTWPLCCLSGGVLVDCVHVCAGQRPTLAAVVQMSFTLCFETGSLTSLKCIKEARLLFLPPQCWDKCVPHA